MTTLWAATTRHRHTDLKEQWKQRYLPYTYHAKGEGQAGSKLSENYPVAKQKVRNDLTFEAEL